MRDALYIYIITIGMAAATYFSRITPFVVLGSKKLSDRIIKWLSFIPAAVMSALLVPSILVKKTGGDAFLYLSLDNLYIWTAIISFIIAFKFKNFFVTIIFGIVFLAAVRYFVG